MKNWTGERLETFIYTRDAIDHLHRYAIASNFTQNKVVLDIASGEGYGSSLMSKNASFVYGVDIDHQAITEAKAKYKDKNLEFLVGNTSEIPLEDSSVEIVNCLMKTYKSKIKRTTSDAKFIANSNFHNKAC